MKKTFNKLMINVSLAALLVASPSCKKHLEIPYPTNSISTETAFNTMGTIDGMLNQLYGYFNTYVIGSTCYRYGTGLSDEGYNPTTTSFIDIQTNNTTPLIPNSFIDWANTYKSIYWANVILEGIPGSPAPGFTDSKKAAYIAAAKAIRGYAYFQLVRNFGDVPLITTSDVPENSLKPRDPAATVYAAIEKDLQDAVAALPATLGIKYFINNKFIPEAMLAEVYLTQGKWAQAEAVATDIIGSNKYQLSGINDAFVQSSTETIMGLPPILSSSNSANSFRICNVPNALSFPEGAGRVQLEGIAFAISPSLLSSFEPGDLRLTNWIVLRNQANYANPNNRMFPYKYKYNNTYYTATIPAGREEDVKLFRLAEIYLIRAEVRAQLNNLSGAAADLNMVRTRAGLANTTAASQTAMVDVVLEERRHELFCEGAYRWHDLVRTGRINTVLSALSYKTNWRPYMKLFPLPVAIMAGNPNLTQTPGY